MDAADEQGVDAVEVLLGDQGRELVEAFSPYDPAQALAQGERARREHPEAPTALVAAAMTQARLRTRAVERLGPDAAHLWFTADGLEQATRPSVAARRATHLAARGATRVADLGCGLGFDSIAFARAGMDVLAVERDPATAALARANVAALGLSDQVTVLTGDAAEFDVSARGCDAVFVDPARRQGGRRVKDPEQWSPSWSTSLALAQSTPVGCLKVAPGIDHDLPPNAATTEWVSDHGALVEACVWLGGAADTGVERRAVVLPSGAAIDDTQLPEYVPSGPLRRYLLEPDDAVIRSGLVGVLVDQVGGCLIDPAIAYVTCEEEPPSSPLHSTFEVIESLPFSMKALRKTVHAHRIGRVEVKKRGSALDPETVRKELRLDPADHGSAVVLLTRIGRDPVAILARRIAATRS